MRLPSIPPLQNGDRLTRDEFERRYEAMPDLKKAELLEGIVYMPSPVSYEGHSRPHFDSIGWLALYRAATPGIDGGDNGTLRLDMENEPQPDCFLFIRPSHGGQARVDQDDYVAGAPELVMEIAASTASYDAHVKKRVYRRNGVKEYIIWRVYDRTVDWFVLEGEEYVPLPLSSDGIYRSKILPGLWLDPAALLAGDIPRVFEIVQRGAASPEHAQFVARLANHT
jgi:Uma2 family endonuclease